MPTEANGILRFDINDPADLAALIKTGLLWRGGPDAIQKGVEYLRENPGAMNAMVPANIRALFDPKQAAPEPETPSEDATEPVEEPTVEPTEPPVA